MGSSHDGPEYSGDAHLYRLHESNIFYGTCRRWHCRAPRCRILLQLRPLAGIAASAPFSGPQPSAEALKKESGGSRDPPELCYTCANDCATLHEATRRTGSLQAAQYAPRGPHDVRPRDSHRNIDLLAALRASEGALATHKRECTIACAQPTVDTHALYMPAHAPGPRATAEGPQRSRVRGRSAKPARLSLPR